ncbi:MAG: type VI secretion system tube protein Hcp [Candidatus Kapabacteria bacterium]|nr:type VI secretion system tube protein Hcp [Candidatus Kapabacteria bacterium]
MSYSFGASNAGSKTSSFSWGLSQTGGIVSPRDPASGQATGKRQHSPIVLTKELDKSSPLLAVAEASAMSSNNPTITIDVNGSTLKVTCNQAMVATYDLKAAKK